MRLKEEDQYQFALTRACVGASQARRSLTLCRKRRTELVRIVESGPTPACRFARSTWLAEDKEPLDTLCWAGRLRFDPSDD